MSRIGVLGGMGPAATVDFMAKLVALTPATCDQDHLPVVVANLPHVPDRSRAILGDGPDPWPHLAAGISVLNAADVGLVVVPCNTSHHWFEAMARASRAPMLHIARACTAALPADLLVRVSLFATRGAIASGFYQRELALRGGLCIVPAPDGAQQAVDACIRAVKGGDLAGGRAHLASALADAHRHGTQAVIMGCTELPLAAAALQGHGLLLIESTLELARQTVRHGLLLGWNRPPWAQRSGLPPRAATHPPAVEPAAVPTVQALQTLPLP
jgi:aspartate racemase